MGVAWYIVAEDPDVQAQLPVVNGKAVGGHVERLGAIAEANGEPPPEAFFSQGDLADVAEDFGLDLSDEEIEGLPEETWFAPEEGLRYVMRLAELVRDDALTPEETRQRVLRDLEEYREALEFLWARSCRWHFAVDY